MLGVSFELQLASHYNFVGYGIPAELKLLYGSFLPKSPLTWKFYTPASRAVSTMLKTPEIKITLSALSGYRNSIPVGRADNIHAAINLAITGSVHILIFDDFHFLISLFILMPSRAEQPQERSQSHHSWSIPDTAPAPTVSTSYAVISLYPTLMANLLCRRIESALKMVSMKSIEYQRQLKELEVLHLTPILLHIKFIPKQSRLAHGLSDFRTIDTLLQEASAGLQVCYIFSSLFFRTKPNL